ncbi:TetR/AcrR family transcriptional regulator, partial [Hydrotalea sp.]
YFFFENNRFTFNNIWEIERNYPQIQTEWLTVNNKILQQLKRRVNLCMQNGLLKPEHFKGEYDLLIQNILIIINSWIPQQILRKKPYTEQLYKKSLWSLLYPNFTPEGITTFNQTIVLGSFF